MASIKSVTETVGCEVCGNNDKQCFEVFLGREKHVFDSFECAMNAMLPRCIHCKRQIIGQGVQLGEVIFCNYECANDCHVRDFEKYAIMHQQS